MDKKFATTNSLLELSKKLLKNDKCVKDVIDAKLDEKVDKVVGKGLSTNDLTDELKHDYDMAVENGHTHSNKSVIDEITSDRVSKWDNKAESNDIPTNISELNNDSNYQTKSDVNTTLLPYAKSEDVTKEITNEIARVVADAPKSLDTLKELSDWIADHEDDASAMNSAIQDNKNNIEKKLDKNQLDDTLTKEGYAADSKTVGDELVKKTFVAVKGETSFSDIQEAYNAKKIVLCKDGWLVTKLDIFAPDDYAQFSGLDDKGNPALLKVTKDNEWTRRNVTNATTDYVNSEINKVNATIANQKTFVAEYGVTTAKEVIDAYRNDKVIILTRDDFSTGNRQSIYTLSYIDGLGALKDTNQALPYCIFYFTCIEENGIHRKVQLVSNTSTGTWSEADYDFGTQLKWQRETITWLDDNFKVLKQNVFDSFRGGFCNNAGTLHIKNPGIYLVIAGGRDNKTITINYPTGKEFEATKWSGIILLAYESGAVTPIGIKSSLAFIDAFQMPGTFQGWTSDGRYSTTISYPSMCVVSYLGNGNVDYLA